MLERGKLVLLQLLAAGLLIGLWALGNWSGVLNPGVLPPVNAVAIAVVEVVARPEFAIAFGATIADALKGLLVAALFAIPLGILIGMVGVIERSTRVVLDFGRAFPVVALLPILVLLLGANGTMKSVAIGIACFFPILLQTIYGARRLDPTIVDTIRAYRIPFRLRFFKVLLPASVPFVATGMRIATTISILVAVGVEIVTLTTGLGNQIGLSRTYGELPFAFAYIVYAGLLGVGLTLIWDALESRLLAWHVRDGAE